MSQPDELTPSRTGWHRLDALHLVAGLVAVAIALSSLLDVDVDGAVVVPALLLAAGVLGVVTAVRRR